MSTRGANRWIAYPIVVFVTLLAGAAYVWVDENYGPDMGPGYDPLVYRALVGLVACAWAFSAQWRLSWLRTIGLALLLWLPCLVAMVLLWDSLGLPVPVPVEGNARGLDALVIWLEILALAEAALVSFGLVRWLRRPDTSASR